MAKKAAPAQTKKRKAVARRQEPASKTRAGSAKARATPPNAEKPTTKLESLIALLRTKRGASVPDMMEATGWQAHSVRGALAGALKKRGHSIMSEKTGNERFYRIEAAQ